MTTARTQATISTQIRRVALLASLVLPLAALAQTVNIGVNATLTTRTAPVDERVFGLNAVMWDGQTGSSQTISLLQAAGVRVIRIPGGSASDAYHWSANKSDSGSPLSLNSWTWGAGFDSFSRLISTLGAQGFVTVNYGSGTPEEAAAWVAYTNASASLGVSGGNSIGIDSYNRDWKTAGYWSSLRAAAPLAQDDGMNFLRLSRSAPFGIKYWEVGNECYGTWEQDINTNNGYHAHDPYTYGVRAKLYITTMKAVDPTIKVGVVAVTTEDANANGYSGHPVTNPRTHVAHSGWTPVMLATMNTATAVLPDFLIYHRYEQGPGAESDSGLLQMAQTWPADATDLRQQLTDYLGSTAGAKVELDVTENNSVYTNPGKQSTSLVNGLYMADSIGNVLQTELNSLVWWDLRNGQDNTQNNSALLYGWRLYGDYGVLSTPSGSQAWGSSTYYDAYPTYYVMKLLQHFARNGDTVVSATTNNTLLSVFATKHNGALRMLVINKSPTSTFSGAITLANYSPPATAVVYSYGMPQDNAALSLGPNAISADLAASNVGVPGATFTMPFAPYSASVVVFGVALPAVTTQASPQTVAPGQNATFTVVASGTPAPTFQWQVEAPGANTWTNLTDGGNYSGSSTATLTITNAPLALNGYQYRCVATNSEGSTNGNAVTLSVRAASADFNGDGKTDLLWQNNVTGERRLWLLNGTSFGSDASLGVVPTQWQTGATGDFNGDGLTDIVWQNLATGEKRIWLMNGTSYQSDASVATTSTSWVVAAAGDFNGDGKTDLVLQNTATGERAVWLMNGTTPSSTVSLGVVPTNWQIAGAGDFNGDGKPDIVWEDNATGARTVWLMNGTTYLSSAALAGAPLPWRIAAVGDFNGDGQTDLVWQNAATGERLIWLLNGTTFSSAVSLGTVDLTWTIGRPEPTSAFPADFNGDGQSDLVWQNTATGERIIWLLNAGSLVGLANLGVVPTAWSIAAHGDFNNDGQSDLVWQNTSTGECVIWLMAGPAFVASAPLGVVPTSWSIAGTGDFNGDGQVDVVWQNTATGERVIWLMSGTALAGYASLGVVPTAWSIAGVGDLNGDGRPDLVWQNTATGERVVWLMNGTTYAGSAALGTVPTAWSIASLGDYNGDGLMDLVWQNTATGERVVWLMNGTTYIGGLSFGTVPVQWSIAN